MIEIKVANIIEDGRIAGPQLRMISVAKQLHRCVSTTLIFPSHDAHLLRLLCERNNVPFVQVKTSLLQRALKPLIHYLISFPFDVLRVMRVIRRGGFDLVHVSGGAWQFRSVLAGWLAGRPVVWHLNDSSMPRAIRVIARGVSPLCSAFIFASFRTQAYYKDLLPSRATSVIQAPVDLVKFNAQLAAEEIIEDMVFCNAQFFVGTVANVNPIKGIETFIEAVAVLRSRNCDVAGVIVGPIFKNQERYTQQIRQRISALGIADHILWAGTQENVKPFLQNMDVYVCSSVSEASPLSVWEAMAMEKAIVSTDVGDVRRYIEKGHSGFIVEVGDHVAMADAIERFLHDSDGRKLAGMHGRETAQKYLSVPAIAAQTFNFYREIMAEIRRQ